ncbi:MAG: lasso RiPP family leader peptide-containing protein [Gemmatimonadales bacterium]|nr:lasso RiPP family leader peptide-containing protein [Gemmatimonadales bacterium]
MQRKYHRPALQRFGTFRELTKAWPGLFTLQQHCEPDWPCADRTS